MSCDFQGSMECIHVCMYVCMYDLQSFHGYLLVTVITCAVKRFRTVLTRLTVCHNRKFCDISKQ